jgi:RecQ family ATP-dependent DNA helicase
LREEDLFPGQAEGIVALSNRRDAFGMMPTSGGKSLIYQLGALCQSKTVFIVVVPLLALQRDQYMRANRLEPGCACMINGTEIDKQNTDDAYRLLGNWGPVSGGKTCGVRLLFVTPELIESSLPFQRLLGELKVWGRVGALIVDEAHCVEYDGPFFRLAYARLGLVRHTFKLYDSCPMLAVTATAAPETERRITEALRMRPDMVSIRVSCRRPHISYVAIDKRSTTGGKKFRAQLIDLLNSHQFVGTPRYPQRLQCGIIYVATKREAFELACWLNDDMKIKARFYHSKSGDDSQSDAMREWGDGAVMVATSAFGMGIDNANVRWVIHATPSLSLSAYIQETGRVGRDGGSGLCYVFFRFQDLLKRCNWEGIKSVPTRLHEQWEMGEFCFDTLRCRLNMIDSFLEGDAYLGEIGSDQGRCMKCDNCCEWQSRQVEAGSRVYVTEPTATDFTDVAILLLRYLQMQMGGISVNDDEDDPEIARIRTDRHILQYLKLLFI